MTTATILSKAAEDMVAVPLQLMKISSLISRKPKLRLSLSNS